MNYDPNKNNRVFSDTSANPEGDNAVGYVEIKTSGAQVLLTVIIVLLVLGVGYYCYIFYSAYQFNKNYDPDHDRAFIETDSSDNYGEYVQVPSGTTLYLDENNDTAYVENIRVTLVSKSIDTYIVHFTINGKTEPYTVTPNRYTYIKNLTNRVVFQEEGNQIKVVFE